MVLWCLLHISIVFLRRSNVVALLDRRFARARAHQAHTTDDEDDDDGEKKPTNEPSSQLSAVGRNHIFDYDATDFFTRSFFTSSSVNSHSTREVYLPCALQPQKPTHLGTCETKNKTHSHTHTCPQWWRFLEKMLALVDSCNHASSIIHKHTAQSILYLCICARTKQKPQLGRVCKPSRNVKITYSRMCDCGNGKACTPHSARTHARDANISRFICKHSKDLRTWNNAMCVVS